MKRLIHLCVIIYSFVSYDALAQDTEIVSGRLEDEQGLALPGGLLRLLPSTIYTISDVHGNFVFLDVPVGEYTLNVEYLGFAGFQQQISVQKGKPAEFKIKLKESGESLNEVVILGDRIRGQAKALNQQKENVNISNIISSDQVGRFPDTNIGDALKRVSGITMQNDQGEARNIIIRGLAPELNSVTLNGDRIPSAEGNNRRVQMDLIPSDMIQTIEVNKTITPDMDADAIGGSVDLITRAAPGERRLSGTLSGGYSPIRQRPMYSGAFVYGDRFFHEKMGLVLSGSYNNNDYGSDNVEASWVKDGNDNVYINQFDIRKYDVKRVRMSVSGAWDYKIDSKNMVSASVMLNRRNDFENRYRLRFRRLRPVYSSLDPSLIEGYEGDIRRQTKGGTPGTNQNRRLEQQTVQNYSLKGTHILWEKVDLDWGLSYSKAEEDRPNERYIEYETRRVSFSNDFDTETQPLLKPVSERGLDSYALSELSENHNNTFETELGGKLNFRVPFSIIDNRKGRLRFGVRARIKTKERNNALSLYDPLNTGEFQRLSDVNTVYWSGDRFNPSSKYVPGAFAANTFLARLPLNDPTIFDRTENPSEYLGLNYKAKEDILAAYLRFDQDLTEKLKLITGVRFENTAIRYTGNYASFDANDNLTSSGQSTASNSYLNILPNLTLNYNVSKDLVLRFAYTTSIARPNYYSLVPYVSAVPGDNSISVGNSSLKSTYANNFDLMGEYYFKSVGLLSLGGFYKVISNFIYTYRNQTYVTQDFSRDFPTFTNPVLSGENWTYTQDRNGDQVSVYGFEVAFQRQLDFLPSFLKYLGVYVNYTYTKSAAKGVYNADGDRREGVTLPGTAPHLFNASLSFENKKLSARVSLNHTEDYLDELGSNAFQDRYYGRQTFLDVNASFKIMKNMRLFAELNNLTNQPLRYYQGVSSRTMQMEYYMARYNFGLKFDF